MLRNIVLRRKYVYVQIVSIRKISSKYAHNHTYAALNVLRIAHVPLAIADDHTPYTNTPFSFNRLIYTEITLINAVNNQANRNGSWMCVKCNVEMLRCRRCCLL